MKHKIDQIDYKILQILQRHARTPLKHISKEVFLSSPAVSSRIEHLENRGIITGYHAHIDSNKLGYEGCAFFTLCFQKEKENSCLNFLRECQNVCECHRLSDEDQFFIKVVFKDENECQNLAQALSDFGKVKIQKIASTLIDASEDYL